MVVPVEAPLQEVHSLLAHFLPWAIVHGDGRLSHQHSNLIKFGVPVEKTAAAVVLVTEAVTGLPSRMRGNGGRVRGNSGAVVTLTQTTSSVGCHHPGLSGCNIGTRTVATP
jgi:hypothetical protein